MERTITHPMCIDVVTSDKLKEDIVDQIPDRKLVVLRVKPSTSEDENSISFLLDTFSKDHKDDNKISRSSYSYTFPHPVNKVRQDLKIVGCCNSLVCIYDLNCVYLINPVRREHNIISSAFLQRSPTKLEMPLTVGFGRDIITGVNKLILIYYFDTVYTEVIVRSDVLTIDNGERRCTTNCFPHYNSICNTQTSVFANGSLFWLTKPCHLDDISANMVAIDLHTEIFREVPFPSLDINYYHGAHLWSMKDRLCLSNVVQFLDVEIWCLKGETPSTRWEKISFINISNIDLLNTNFWTLGLATAYFSYEGEEPQLGDLEQVPFDQWKMALIQNC